MIDRLPSLGVEDLRTLAINAENLALTGTPEKRALAHALLPAIHLEVSGRLNSGFGALSPKEEAGRTSRLV
ncbi:hypothetical protein [Azospirillum griseum]|uniref:Uncharacterized protein n=1 Tax=Azospirillum griseum TaxID=2496639 RepID=A0A431VKX2_9PROT|nr:hypothetical protein [Azospirillum griseum]RTR22938.1 hypothetical protein EJ903_05005 [Azospirillum griseum]